MTYRLHVLNQQVLNNITMYRQRLDRSISSLFQEILMGSNENFFLTPNYKFYSLISENMRMNLNYLLYLGYIEYDAFNFIGVSKNLRSSIEALYDLYNLTYAPNYIDLLEYYHDKSFYSLSLNNYSSYLNEKYLSIKSKADIAVKHNFDMNLFSYYKTKSENANPYVHYDIFNPVIEIQEKDKSLRELIEADCFVLKQAYDLLISFCKQKYAFLNMLDSTIEFESMNQGNNSMPLFIPVDFNF